MQRYHGTSVLSRNSAASTARSATQNGAIDHPQPGADKVDSALPVVRAGAVSLHRLGHLRSFPQRRLAFLTISLSIATGNPATFTLWLERRRPHCTRPTPPPLTRAIGMVAGSTLMLRYSMV